jgi:hypothetical protein
VEWSGGVWDRETGTMAQHNTAQHKAHARFGPGALRLGCKDASGGSAGRSELESECVAWDGACVS